jgi:transposase-like protein
MDDAARLRRQAGSFENRKARTATRYPTAFRQEAVAIARERRSAGAPIARIARELGLRSRTLALWLRRAPKRRVRRVTLAQEATMTPKPSAALTVRVGSVEIAGLELSGVVALVRALGS